MTHETLEVSLLGECTLRIAGKALEQKGIRSKKMYLLFAMLLCSRGKSVTQEKLMALLWPEDSDCMDPSNALKNQIYRARQLLNGMMGTETDFIVFSKNTYAWNPQIPCVIDIEALEQAASLREGSREELAEAYQNALLCYRGEFMENITGENWVYAQRAYYESLFVRCVLKYCGILQETAQLGELITVCESALVRCPFQEEIHLILLNGYMKTGQHKKALEHYSGVSESFSRELGVGLPESIHSMYQDIISDIHWVEKDVKQMKKQLLSNQSDLRAFLCEYPVFQQLCLLQLRSRPRNGQTMLLALLTVTDCKGATPAPASLKYMMAELQGCILETLRKNDMVSRYSPSQFALGLVVSNPNDGKVVIRRIRSVFEKRLKKEGLRFEEQIAILG